MKVALLSFLALGVFTGTAFADPIEGSWKRPNGILVKISACGDSYCVVAASGAHAGGSAGKLSPAGSGKYAGSLTDLETGKTYKGKASVSGASLTVAGCVLGGLLCQSENWVRP